MRASLLVTAEQPDIIMQSLDSVSSSLLEGAELDWEWSAWPP
jgi:hypothetical protein